MENRFGVDSSYKENLFLHLKREAGEDGLDFIQRVEDMRIKLCYDDKAALIKTWGDLPHNIKEELERIHDTLDKGKIQWKDVMRYAVRKMAQRDSGRANR